jgi:hypothetical protein
MKKKKNETNRKSDGRLIESLCLEFYWELTGLDFFGLKGKLGIETTKFILKACWKIELD